MKYSIFDFDLTFSIATNWPAFQEVVTVTKSRPKRRLTGKEQTEIWTMIEKRLNLGLPFLRSSNTFKPTLLVLGSPEVKKSIEIRDYNRFIGSSKVHVSFDWINTNTINTTAINKETYYLSLDGISSKDYETIYCGSLREMRDYIASSYIHRTLTLENWVNVKLSTGRDLVESNDITRQLYKMYSPYSKSALFGNMTLREFIDETGYADEQLLVLNAEYYVATTLIMFPSHYNAVSLSDYNRRPKLRTVNIIVDKTFKDTYKLSNNDKLEDSEVMKTRYDFENSQTWYPDAFKMNTCFDNILEHMDSDNVEKSIMLGLAVYTNCLVKVLDWFPYSNAAISAVYNMIVRGCKRHNHIIIAAPKGSGKSRISKKIDRTKNVVLDSDTYGRVAYGILNGEINYTSGDVETLAKYIHKVISDPDFDERKSFHEEYIKQYLIMHEKTITTSKILTNALPLSLWRNISIDLSAKLNSILTRQDFIYAAGFLTPSGYVNNASSSFRLVEFTHTTDEGFYSMGTTRWKMETFFSPNYITLLRSRESDPITQYFLYLYYINTDNLVSQGIPLYLIDKVIDFINEITVD